MRWHGSHQSVRDASHPEGQQHDRDLEGPGSRWADSSEHTHHNEGHVHRLASGEQLRFHRAELYMAALLHPRPDRFAQAHRVGNVVNLAPAPGELHVNLQA